MHAFAEHLIAWQKSHGRHDLPWQATRDPYRIWLSEIMLQQTQVAAVIAYYERFLAAFPDLPALARAAQDEVLRRWSGLGYYARARNLQRCAQKIVAEHGGEFPRDPQVLATLPGIGRSTAAAICAFAFATRAAILDGNVKRVFARRFGIEGFPGERAVEARMWALADELLPQQDIGAYTQGLMDLGATVCTRRKPRCGQCPLRTSCAALAAGSIDRLPSPRPRRVVPRRRARMLVLREGDRVLLERRPPAGVWGGLLALPEVEGDDTVERAAQRLGLTVTAVEALTPMQHGFTHFELEIEPWLARVAPGAATLTREDNLEWLPLDDIAEAALPAPLKRLLAKLAGPTLL